MQVQGSHVLVTGASKGIGESLCKEFSRAGARVSATARSLARLQHVADATGAKVFPVDLATPDAAHQLISTVERSGAGIDILVNNASVALPKRYLEYSPSEISHIYQVNLVTPATLVHAVLPGMLKRGRGWIVNVTSIMAPVPSPGLLPYASSKAALTNFTYGLRMELRGTPVGTTLVELSTVTGGGTFKEIRDSPRSSPARRFLDTALRLRLASTVDRTVVAAQVVKAIQAGRRYVRIPARVSPWFAINEFPHWLGEKLFGLFDAARGTDDLE